MTSSSNSSSPPSPNSQSPVRDVAKAGGDEQVAIQEDGEVARNAGDAEESGERRADTAPADPSSQSDGEVTGDEPPPLPNEPVPEQQDDGWDCHWDQTSQSWFFYNRFTKQTTWDNPRTSTGPNVGSGPVDATGTGSAALAGSMAATGKQVAGGYNPAIHGDYDPNAWYAQGQTGEDEETENATETDAAALYGATATFNRFTGQFQTAENGPERHSDEAKSKRQLNAYFDVDAAANAHDGRSLKAERSGKKPSKAELKHFKEKRRARKEEKRRAWLRD